MLPSLDSDLLRTFLTVAEQKHFTRAGQLLGLTQSAVSLQIRKLEQQLDTELLQRDNRRVELTAAGEAFAGYAQRLLDLQHEAVRQVRDLNGALSLRVGMPDVYASRHLPAVLEPFLGDHPGLIPEVTCLVSTELQRRFATGELDVVLGIRHDGDPQAEVLGYEQLAWVRGRRLELDRDGPVPLALYPDYCVFRAHGLRALNQLGRPWRIVYTSESSAAIDIAIDRGYAVAIKAASTLSPRWVQLAEEDGLPTLEPVAVELHLAPRADASARQFAALLRERMRSELAG